MTHAKSVTIAKARKAVEAGSNSDTLYVVFCGQPWCGYCRKVQPVFENVATQFSCCNIKFFHVDMSEEADEGDKASTADSLESWLKEFGKPMPEGWPTFYCFKHGKYKAITQGYKSNDEMRAWLVNEGMDCSSEYCSTNPIKR